LTKLFFAAPESFFSLACDSQAAVAALLASLSHFLTKLFFAALESFFSAAWASQPEALAVGANAAVL
jgi:hypothetical protein